MINKKVLDEVQMKHQEENGSINQKSKIVI